jgi:hypothetical protein
MPKGDWYKLFTSARDEILAHKPLMDGDVWADWTKDEFVFAVGQESLRSTVTACRLPFASVVGKPKAHVAQEAERCWKLAWEELRKIESNHA